LRFCWINQHQTLACNNAATFDKAIGQLQNRARRACAQFKRARAFNLPESCQNRFDALH
jgi:hypothetical protein